MNNTTTTTTTTTTPSFTTLANLTNTTNTSFCPANRTLVRLTRPWADGCRMASFWSRGLLPLLMFLQAVICLMILCCVGYFFFHFFCRDDIAKNAPSIIAYTLISFGFFFIIPIINLIFWPYFNNIPRASIQNQQQKDNVEIMVRTYFFLIMTAYACAKMSMYMHNLKRLRITFDNTVLKVKPIMANLLQFALPGTAIVFMIAYGLLTFLGRTVLTDRFLNYCLTIFFYTDSLYGLLLLWLFSTKLYTLLRTPNGGVRRSSHAGSDDQIYEVIVKYTYLVILANISSVIAYCVYFWFLEPFGVHLNMFHLFLSIDALFNVVCLFLVFRFVDHIYKRMCIKCQNCMVFCCRNYMSYCECLCPAQPSVGLDAINNASDVSPSPPRRQLSTPKNSTSHRPTASRTAESLNERSLAESTNLSVNTHSLAAKRPSGTLTGIDQGGGSV